MKKLEDQAEAAIKAQNDAEEKAESTEALRKVLEAEKIKVEEKASQAQKELQNALATKDAEIRDTDEKAYAQGMADVTEAYEKQLDVPEDSPLRNADAIPLPFPPSPPPSQHVGKSESEDDDEDEDEDEALMRKSKEAAGNKSPSLNEQVLDLTQDDEGEKVPKDAAAENASADVPLAVKSFDETLAKIDAELMADKAAEMSSQQSSELQTQPTATAEES
ncbi:radixin-like [Camellia sinensis]|uniref:radixin-like n=1 Tax=Camellia sinensis TaxID=4442 RepID=UPI001035F04A|nr:radixin-like [Camellia sinensis]